MVKNTTISEDVPITADHVAKAAGVSRWTVNRAFRRDASISDKSREKVLAAAAKLGYAPDLLASSLASDRSNLVALLVDDFGNPHKMVMIEQLTRILRSSGWDSLLVNMLSESDAPDALVNASQRRVDATILLGVEFGETVLATAQGARKIKKLIVFARSSDNPDTISISTDDEIAIGEIADYCFQKGYRAPLFVAGPETLFAHVARQDIFCSLWHQKTGATPPVIRTSAYDSRLSYKAVEQHLETLEETGRPDVLVCENDALAIGAIDAIRHRLNLRVPEDIAVIGFDDVPLASNPNYDLTTYRQPIETMAEYMIEVLENRVESELSQIFKGQLIIRHSA
ncbi:substrate-binding domain-containing protein [uncultured Cohaesibacter sp.]|uniref:LacI family DNA-binding transcriptional regulator n=1 Tax=uncultured Cohaesibacter sp. TaxID=1002546 RepID=UPI00292FD3AB|nr:substrate-binding domain-containing protein [uncultured Cohaesibacter sp.]